ncbi:MAG: CARDB domain-containing protein [Candidatus Micrarchaeota archaeon]
MDLNKILFALVLVALISLAFAAPPSPPARFGGATFVNGQNAPAKVSVEIEGVEVGSTDSLFINGSWKYLVEIESDDLDTPQKEGGSDGEKLVFKLNGFEAGENVWKAGANELDKNLSILLDFSIDAVFAPEKAVTGDEGSINVIVGSNVKAEKVKVAFFDNQEKVAEQTVALTNSKNWVFFKWIPEWGNHKLLVMVDPDNEYGELNEENNVRLFTAQAEERGLAVLLLNMPFAGEELEVQALSKGKPVEGALVEYGEQTGISDSLGKTTFIAVKGANSMFVSKEGYASDVISVAIAEKTAGAPPVIPGQNASNASIRSGNYSNGSANFGINGTNETNGGVEREESEKEDNVVWIGLVGLAAALGIGVGGVVLLFLILLLIVLTYFMMKKRKAS